MDLHSFLRRWRETVHRKPDEGSEERAAMVERLDVTKIQQNGTKSSVRLHVAGATRHGAQSAHGSGPCVVRKLNTSGKSVKHSSVQGWTTIEFLGIAQPMVQPRTSRSMKLSYFEGLC